MPIPKIVVTAALMVAQVAIGMAQKIKGPRLEDLSVSVADYGTPIPRFWGMRRIQPQTIWAEPLHETKKKSKGKGGKYEEYKYDGTWACLICDHEIDAVSRIWMDKHLVWQRRQPGPISIGGLFTFLLGPGPVKLTPGRNMRVYLGTEDQEADPRMVAWCEDRYGPDSCPSYKGSAYIVFQQIPLEKFGNRIPQITIEAIHNKTDAFPYEIKDNAGSGINGVFSPDGSIMYQEDGDRIYVWDVANRELITSHEGPFGAITAATGNIYSMDGGFSPESKQLWRFEPDGGNGDNLTPLGFEIFTGAGLRFVSGSILFYPVTRNETYYGIFASSTVVGIDIGFPPTHYFQGPNESVWAVGVDAFTEDNLNVRRIVPEALVATANHSTGGGDAYGMWNGDGGFVIWQNGQLYLLDDEDPSIVLAGPVAHSVAQAYAAPAFEAALPGSALMWIGFSEIDTATLGILRTVEPNDWISQLSLTGGCYDVVNHALVTHQSGTDEITWRYLDRVDSDGVDLKNVVDDVSDWCGLNGPDTAALTQTVQGYSVTQGTGKDMISPLLEIHDVDARPHDFSVQFVNRGASPSATLVTTEDFVREGDADRYTVTVQQDTDLPRKLTFNYADKDHDQQTNTAISQRPLDAMESSREETIDLSTYVSTPDEAQRLGDRFFRRIWNSRDRMKMSLTAQNLSLEPGDVRTISLDGSTRTARLDKLTIARQTLECEWVRDDPDIAILNDSTGAAMEGRDPETIYIPALSKGFVKDIPLIEDADNDVNPVIYYAAGPYGDGSWPGAGVYRGDDGTYDDLWGFVESGTPATWGYSTDALATANPNLWDRGNTVNVKTFYGTLTSATEAEIDADTSLNLALLGDEMLQFATATLEGDGTYTLSDLKRGRRGTEWAVSDHAVGEEFALCADFLPVEMGTDDVGDSLSFKVQSVGRDIDAAAAIDVTYTGASLRPYAPARIIWTTDGTDLFGEIIRRTRVGGAWNGGSTIPVGETTEAYEVDVLDGADVVRTITATGTNTFTYVDADLTGDGFSLTDIPDVNVYQLSDAVGRGFALAA